MMDKRKTAADPGRLRSAADRRGGILSLPSDHCKRGVDVADLPFRPLLLGRKQLFCRNIPFRRGEVVLFRHENETCLKRIYALPGDEVVIFRLDEGFNLLVQTADYIRYYRLAEEIGQARIDRFEVPEGELFLLGDAPQISLDSRDFGPVPQSAVIARIPAER